MILRNWTDCEFKDIYFHSLYNTIFSSKGFNIIIIAFNPPVLLKLTNIWAPSDPSGVCVKLITIIYNHLHT